MGLPVKFEEVNDKIVTIREQNVILDSDVAKLYGVETRDINKAVKNNPEKFPEGYIFELTKQEFDNLRWKIPATKILTADNKKQLVENFHRFDNLKHSTVIYRKRIVHACHNT